jgi:hypothetical protein
MAKEDVIGLISINFEYPFGFGRSLCDFSEILGAIVPLWYRSVMKGMLCFL